VAAIKRQGGDRIGPRVMAAQTAPLAGIPGCHWPTPAVETAFLVSGDWPSGRGHASVRWACFPETAMSAPVVRAGQVRCARDFTVSTLRRWGVAERRDDVVVVVSELLTNALRYASPASTGTGAGWPVQLGLLQRGCCITCAVADPSRAAPVPGQPGYLAETGRGLHVIAALSDRWGFVAPGDQGKVIWALFSTQLAPPSPGGRS
jgi:Histidine kinase-like ATPase domain